MTKKNKYSDCFFCGGKVVEKLITREVRWKGKLFIIEKVSAGVCNQCGEKVIKSNNAKAIDKIIQQKSKPIKTVQIPVYSL